MHKEVQIVSSTKLQVDETLRIKRSRYSPEVNSDGLPRLCIVTGIHGDELEGQYMVYELARRMSLEPHKLKGIVDLYPGMNPLGIDSITRSVPGYDLDMNRIFPGRIGNTMIETVAANIVDSLLGADLVLDYHASNAFLFELPQARIAEEFSRGLLPYARALNLDLVWVHPAATVLESTLSHALNSRQTPCVVVEAGIGMRVTRSYGNQLVDGIFAVMKDMGIWEASEDVAKPTPYMEAPLIVNQPDQVFFINAQASGLFIPEVEHGAQVCKGDLIGRIVNPLEATILETVVSQVDGLLFTLREYPLVYSGSLIGRIIASIPNTDCEDPSDD